MPNNLGLVFKTFLIVIKNWIKKNKKLKKNKILFKVIKKRKTYIKAKYKTFINFDSIKLNAKL